MDSESPKHSDPDFTANHFPAPQPADPSWPETIRNAWESYRLAWTMP